MAYTPLAYGSKEYLELRRTVRTSRDVTTVAGRRVTIEKKTADRPGLWTVETDTLYSIIISATPIPGLSSNVSEVLAWDESLACALLKAADELEKRDRGEVKPW